MSAVKNIKNFSLLEKSRKNKILLFLIFLAALLCSYIIYYYQLDWLDFNCNYGRNSKSCIYKTQRLFLIPLLGFIGCFVVLFLDKIAHSIVALNNKFESLSARTSGIILIIYAIALSIFLFNYRFSFYILDPTRISWIWSVPGGDAVQNFLGWHMFRDVPWEFPLGLIKSLNYPTGITVAYTDPNILFCFIFKIFNKYLPNDFQYIGMWFLLCYVLQGLFAALIFKNIQCELKLKLLSIPFLIFSTVLLDRVMHMNLNAHWLILASFYLYFSKEMSPEKKFIRHAFIVYLTAWIHPYLAFILFALHSALFIKIFFEDKKQFKFLTIIFSLTLLSVLLTWYEIGYFYLGGGYEYVNFTYSSNFNTFFNSLGNSTFLKPLANWPEDYEGFSYLGFGILIILVVLVFEKWPREKYVFNKENKSLLWIVVSAHPEIPYFKHLFI